MSLKNILIEEKKSRNKIIFLGKKLDKIEMCKFCQKKDNIDLVKCVKCLDYYCKECLKNIFGITFKQKKLEEYTCPYCEKKIEENKNKNKCFICKKSFDENNFTYFNVTPEQKNNLKNEINYIINKKEISLEEEEDLNVENNEIMENNSIIICKECNSNYENSIKKFILLKTEKTDKKETNTDIIDELKNLIMKENGNMEINIFDLLENINDKNEDSSNDNKTNTINKKTKDLFESMIVERKKDNIQEQKNKSVVNKKENNYNKTNNIKNDFRDIGIKLKKNEKNIPSININSNNKTSNIYLPNFFTITQTQTNQNSNNQNISNKNQIPQSLLGLPNFLNKINQQNDFYLRNNIKPNPNMKDIKNIIDFQNQIPNLINNQINNKLNMINFDLNKAKSIEDNKNILKLLQQNNNILNSNNNSKNSNDNNNSELNNLSKNLIETKEGVNNLININESNNNRMNNINNNQNLNMNIKDTLDKISKCLYVIDNNNIENNLNILNKIELLLNDFSNLIKENKNEQKIEDKKENKNELNIITNTDKNKEIINNISNEINILKNEIKIQKSSNEEKKLHLSNLYQYIDIYLKEMNDEQNNKNLNQILLPQPNINSLISQLNTINALNNLQGINLLNVMPNLDINNLSHGLNLPIILANNNNIPNNLPIFGFPISIPNILNQPRVNNLGNPLFQK